MPLPTDGRIDGAEPLYRVALSDAVRAAAGAAPVVRHYADSRLLPPPYELALARYEDDDEVYLFYLNEHGETQSDTLHDSIADAFAFATCEFGIERSDWYACGGRG
jgi:hypothetical protein